MADPLEEKLQEKLGNGFEEKIASKIGDFGGLLTRAAAVRLLCKQHGIEVERRLSLKQAEGSQLPFSIEARVDRIYPVQEYPGGTRSVRVHLSDQSGSATLVLWNEQAGYVEGRISIGDIVECRGAYFRSGEIALTRSGSVLRSKAFPVFPVEKLEHGICNVEGEVGEIEEDYHYLDRKTGEAKSLSSFQLCSNGACRRVVVWSSPEGTPKPQQGDRLLLENVLFKNSELHFNAHSRLLVRKAKRELSGKMDGAFVEGGNAVLVIGGRRFELPLAQALRLFGISSVPAGVEEATVFSIRSQEALGKRFRFAAEGGQLQSLSLQSQS